MLFLDKRHYWYIMRIAGRSNMNHNSCFELTVTGMSCAACAGRLEKVLNRLDDVSATVNFASSKARIHWQGKDSQLKVVLETIQKAGFDVQRHSLVLAVPGMNCVACASRIERVLNQVVGIDATVSFATSRAQITFVAGAASAASVMMCIEKLGFHAQPVSRSNQPDVRSPQALAWQRDLRQLSLSLLLTLPLLSEMGAMLLGYGHFLPGWLQLLLATPVQFWCGRYFYYRAWRALRAGSANMDVLVALGTSMAYCFSLYTLLILQQGHLYFEASAMIITLVLLGKMLEGRARTKTGAAMAALLNLQPQIAHVEADGEWQDCDVSLLQAGDVFLVRPGECIPTDGVVIEGESEVSEAMLTGESLPVIKNAESSVYGATQNHHGLLRIRATRVGHDTALARIIRLVEEAQSSKTHVQRLADKIAALFVPAVVSIALLTLLLNILLTQSWSLSLMRAVAVLVIACPCALGLATPAAIIVGTGQGARAGILFRRASALEKAQQLHVLVMDKTGTLTEGHPGVTQILPVAGVTRGRLIGLALGLEQYSEHPLAQALVSYARQAGISATPVCEFRVIVGRGAEGDYHNQVVLLGSPALLCEQGIDFDAEQVASLEKAGNTVVGVALDGVLQGIISFADPLRREAKNTVQALHQRGIQVVMLTGDNIHTAERIASQAGIKQVIAGVLPAQKAAEIVRLKEGGYCVGMVGDGINDAPALAEADIGFAIGAGSDIALNTADVVLMQNNLTGLVSAISLSSATLRKVKQNLFFAFFYNTLGIPLAAFGMLNPVIAGMAMALSSVSVLTNSLLLRHWKPDSQ